MKKGTHTLVKSEIGLIVCFLGKSSEFDITLLKCLLFDEQIEFSKAKKCSCSDGN